MSVLELKGQALDMISRIQNPEDLQRIIMTIQEIMAEHFDEEGDGWEDLTPEQQADLELAIEESYDPKNWASQEEVAQKLARWSSR